MAAYDMDSSPSPALLNKKPSTEQPHPADRIVEYYNSRLSMIFGIVLLGCAAVGLILNALGIAHHVGTNTNIHDLRYKDSGGYLWQDTFAYYIGTGIWCNVVIGISGALALYASFKKTYCMVISNMVMSILAAVFAFLMLGMSCWAFGHDVDRLLGGLIYRKTEGTGVNSYEVKRVEESMISPAKKSLAISTLFVAVSVVELVICVLISTLCCRVTCFNETSTASGYRPDTDRILIVDGKGQTLPDAHLTQVSSKTEQETEDV